MSLSIKDYDDFPQVPLRPYQTILLMEKTDDFLASLPPVCYLSCAQTDGGKDASEAIKSLVRATKPTISFSLLQSETGIPLPQLYRFDTKR